MVTWTWVQILFSSHSQKLNGIYCIGPRGQHFFIGIPIVSMGFYRTTCGELAVSWFSLTWWQGLFELLCLLLVGDDQGVQVPAAAHLEFDIVLVLLDLDSYKGQTMWC